MPLLFILSFAIGYLYRHNAYIKYTSMEFNGIIEDIKTAERNTYIFKVKNNWIDLGGNGSDVEQFITNGDSIVKNLNTDSIEVYRFDSANNEFIKYVFICNYYK